MTLAEKLRMEGKLEGKLEGLLEGLELAITLKYPETASQIIMRLHQIKDAAILRKIKEMIAESRTSTEIMTHISSH